MLVAHWGNWTECELNAFWVLLWNKGKIGAFKNELSSYSFLKFVGVVMRSTSSPASPWQHKCPHCTIKEKKKKHKHPCWVNPMRAPMGETRTTQSGPYYWRPASWLHNEFHKWIFSLQDGSVLISGLWKFIHQTNFNFQAVVLKWVYFLCWQLIALLIKLAQKSIKRMKTGA